MEEMDKTNDIYALIQSCTLHEEIKKWNQSCGAIQSPHILTPEGIKKMLGIEDSIYWL
jgi:hypothetical protein